MQTSNKRKGRKLPEQYDECTNFCSNDRYIMFSLFRQEFDNAPVMTQPWSPQTPKTNDYAVYDVTTGK